MRKLFSLTAVAMAAATAAQAPDGPTRLNDLCYLECQYRCFYAHPGGGPDWTACDIACGQANCQSG